MNTILCYGDSNTFGTPPNVKRGELRRFAPEQRWPGVMRDTLGPGWSVIEEGLPARTTVHDDPILGAHKNGLVGLRPALESHRPLDIVIVMLGTNDLKARFSVPAEDIADSVGVLLGVIAGSVAGPEGKPPRMLVIAPPPLGRIDAHAGMFAGGAEKAQQFGRLYAAVAEQWGAAFLDAGRVIRPSDIDGIHFDADAHEALGKAVAEVVSQMNKAGPLP